MSLIHWQQQIPSLRGTKTHSTRQCGAVLHQKHPSRVSNSAFAQQTVSLSSSTAADTMWLWITGFPLDTWKCSHLKLKQWSFSHRNTIKVGSWMWGVTLNQPTAELNRGNNMGPLKWALKYPMLICIQLRKLSVGTIATLFCHIMQPKNGPWHWPVNLHSKLQTGAVGAAT